MIVVHSRGRGRDCGACGVFNVDLLEGSRLQRDAVCLSEKTACAAHRKSTAVTRRIIQEEVNAAMSTASSPAGTVRVLMSM